MANSYFQFKQFLIHQDRCAMKLGTDALLLGASAHQANPKMILDIGMGTGVIGLMLAQRFPNAQVHGVEIEEEAYNQAAQNVKASPWGNRMEVFHAAFQDYSKNDAKKYDLIVSNPPYYSNQLKSVNPRKNVARHDEQLSLKDLMEGVKSLLSDNGLFWLILPIREMKFFKEMALHYDLTLQHQYLIRDQPGIEPHREICSYGKGDFNGLIRIREIHLKEDSGRPGKAYSKLVKNFLLYH